MNDTIERSQTHATFVIERTYPAPVRRSGTHCPTTTRATSGSAPARRSTSRRSRTTSGSAARGTEDGQWHGGPRSRFQSTYTDIVDLQRIVFTYDMWVDGRHMSTSLTTIALEPDGDRTRLTYTEQGVHFDGLDSVEGREEGSQGLLDQLGSYLAAGH